MSDKFTKIILFGILICLAIISFKTGHQKIETLPSPNVTINNDNIVQIAPNIIGVRDNGSHTGFNNQLLIFEYDTTAKSFKYTGAFNYGYYLDHPEEFEIPKKQNNK